MQIGQTINFCNPLSEFPNSRDVSLSKQEISDGGLTLQIDFEETLKNMDGSERSVRVPRSPATSPRLLVALSSFFEGETTEKENEEKHLVSRVRKLLIHASEEMITLHQKIEKVRGRMERNHTLLQMHEGLLEKKRRKIHALWEERRATKQMILELTASSPKIKGSVKEKLVEKELNRLVKLREKINRIRESKYKTIVRISEKTEKIARLKKRELALQKKVKKLSKEELSQEVAKAVLEEIRRHQSKDGSSTTHLFKIGAKINSPSSGENRLFTMGVKSTLTVVTGKGGKLIDLIVHSSEIVGKGASRMVKASPALSGELIRQKPIKKRRNLYMAENIELAILHELHHPNIISIAYTKEKGEFDRSSTDLKRVNSLPLRRKKQIKEPLLFFERLSGTIEKIWKSRDLEKIMKANIELLYAVAYCHQHEVYHRDLKPDNIGIDRNGRVKLFDFNVSRWGGMVEVPPFAGTSCYSTPEAQMPLSNFGMEASPLIKKFPHLANAAKEKGGLGTLILEEQNVFALCCVIYQSLDRRHRLPPPIERIQREFRNSPHENFAAMEKMSNLSFSNRDVGRMKKVLARAGERFAAVVLSGLVDIREEVPAIPAGRRPSVTTLIENVGEEWLHLH